jgi:hypothetical protein
MSSATVFQLGGRSGPVSSTKPPQAEEGFCRCFCKRLADPLVRSMTEACKAGLGSTTIGGVACSEDDCHCLKSSCR